MVLTIFDLLLAPLYALLFYFLAKRVENNNKSKHPMYRWYAKGMLVKMVGAVAVCLIYQFYYRGGDTISYYETSRAIAFMAGKDSSVFWSMLAGHNTMENLSNFDVSTGFPVYWMDEKALFVSRLIVPLFYLSFGSYIVMSLMLSFVCYSGIWKLFVLFNSYFPMLQKQFAIAFLFIPSVVFWGSGLLKDTITLSAVGWFTFYFHDFFIRKKFAFSSIAFVLISSYLLIAIKPYIFFALLPGSILWLVNQRLASVQNKILKSLIAPFFILVGIGLSFLVLSQMSDALGIYAIDNVMERAVVVNLDQKQEYYQGNSFDIGKFDANPLSMLGKAHLAIAATLFRPYLWDVKNIVMFISALENTYILLLTFFLLAKLKFVSFFTLIGKNALLLFSFLFSLFFAFSVGITTSNFGSLVRLKIPCIPFYIAGLFILKYYYDQKQLKRLNRRELNKAIAHKVMK